MTSKLISLHVIFEVICKSYNYLSTRKNPPHLPASLQSAMYQIGKGCEITGGESESTSVSTSRTGLSSSLRRTSDGYVSASACKFMIMGRVTSMLRTAKHTITSYQKCHYRISKTTLPHV